MNWTKTPPTKPGIYYWESGRKEKRPVEVYNHNGELIAFGRNVFDEAGGIGGQWCGPLVPVEEVEKAYREGWRDCLFSDTIIDGNYATSRARKIVEGEV